MTIPHDSPGHGIPAHAITLRPVTADDTPFLHRLFASTRREEMALTGWNDDQVEAFLTMQFELQQHHYLNNYPGADFFLISIHDLPAGRLFLQQSGDDMRIIDISLLPDFRGRGAGGIILRDLVRQADATGMTMSLHVEMANPVRSFYQSLGFREMELRGIYYYMERKGGAEGRQHGSRTSTN